MGNALNIRLQNMCEKALTGIALICALITTSQFAIAQEQTIVQPTPHVQIQNYASATPSMLPTPTPAPAYSDLCINMMRDFPDDTLVNRYQLFRLIEMMEVGVDSGVSDALTHFGMKNSLGTETVVEITQNLSDPVMLQSQPRYSIGNAAQLIGYAKHCKPFIASQVASIEAAEPSVNDGLFQEQLAEDSVYLRALVIQSLESVSADKHALHGPAVKRYADGTIWIRNEAEFAGFEAELDALSIDALTDLDQKLMIHRDVVEEEADKEIMSSSSEMVNSMNEQSKIEAQRKTYQIMCQISGSCRY
jgi:hypothetical protein